jgi:hypothetical protein
MPDNGDESLYYSYDYRNAHIIVLNSETIDEFHYSSMYQWLLADLESVDRSVTPWVLAMFHHPWYCSNLVHNDSAWFMKAEYEQTFYQFGVDMVLQGHVHAYERTLPVYNWKLNPNGPVYVVNGMAGNGLHKPTRYCAIAVHAARMLRRL